MNGKNTPSAAKKPDRAWKIIKIVICLLLLVCILYCTPLREVYWKFRVETCVRLHQDALNEYVESFPLDRPLTSQDYHGWEVTSYPVREADDYADGLPDHFDGDDYIIQFDRYAFGIVTSGSYAGMYYSPEDMPVGFQGVFADRPGADGPDGETEKICDHWYWFIARF